MIIKLSKDCRIVGEDGIQFTLQVRERVTDKAVGGRVSERAGELSGWKTRGYYATLEQACKGAVKRVELSKGGQLSARDLCTFLERVTRRIERTCDGVITARVAAEMDGAVESDELDELFADDVKEEV